MEKRPNARDPAGIKYPDSTVTGIIMTAKRQRPVLEYAPRGLLGVLTPQANTTVEPEFALLLPPGYALINARLTSRETTIEARLKDYLEHIQAGLDQFANAPLAAAAFACTGASYLAGREREDALVAEVRRRCGYPLVTAALAVCDALGVLGAANIGLVSPYPPTLTEASVGYWQSRGFTIGDCASVYNPESDFHPIYSLGAASAAAALAELRGRPLDAVVLLGTGMPTLAPLAARHDDGPPSLSCMLALAWRAVTAADAAEPNVANLAPWLSGAGWAARLAQCSVNS